MWKGKREHPGSRSVSGRWDGWFAEHSMQRQPSEKTGGVTENSTFGKLQTIPCGRITEFKATW